MAVFAPAMNTHIQTLLIHMRFSYHREHLQEGMNTFGISLNKSPQDTLAIAERATRARCNGEGVLKENSQRTGYKPVPTPLCSLFTHLFAPLAASLHQRCCKTPYNQPHSYDNPAQFSQPDARAALQLRGSSSAHRLPEAANNSRSRAGAARGPALQPRTVPRNPAERRGGDEAQGAGCKGIAMGSPSHRCSRHRTVRAVGDLCFSTAWHQIHHLYI
ncbi:uncharacterized protein LOC142052246 [Phalacrocorax aristotelis]|uniref:uncharacterized protein LOC142052246 n=1 Tax=Phalacrocorax aristotelis TaxID=126867 RepID=UPI003F4B96C7